MQAVPAGAGLGPPSTAVAAAKSLATPIATVKSDPPAPNEAEFEFSDVGALMCLLCARQFKSSDQLRRHNKESDLHKARHLQCCILQCSLSANVASCASFPSWMTLRFVVAPHRKTTGIPIYGKSQSRRSSHGKQHRPTNLNTGTGPLSVGCYLINLKPLSLRRTQARGVGRGMRDLLHLLLHLLL